MKNFIKLSSVLSSIPSSLFQEGNEADFLDYLLDGLKLLPSSALYEPKIEIFEIIDGKVQLPKYVRMINKVMWQCTDPSKDCLDELLSCCTEPEPSDINPAICKPTITYKMWLDSPYYKDNYKIIRYTGTDKSMIKKSCPNTWATCSESFVVTPNKTMYLSIDSGFLSIDFDAPVCDEDGDILIPDIQILHEFLIAYAISKHWENRQFSKEEQARDFMINIIKSKLF